LQVSSSTCSSPLRSPYDEITPILTPPSDVLASWKQYCLVYCKVSIAQTVYPSLSS
jgi:hypothetical protein